MCGICNLHIMQEAFKLLQPIIEIHGEQKVIDAIHDYYHNKGK